MPEEVVVPEVPAPEPQTPTPVVVPPKQIDPEEEVPFDYRNIAKITICITIVVGLIAVLVICLRRRNTKKSLIPTDSNLTAPHDPSLEDYRQRRLKKLQSSINSNVSNSMQMKTEDRVTYSEELI